ncbi:MAG TPA: restriction endonuclease subunit S [Archangium sp.]|nr:restriction endonuclease subunit S [Archangium sp.]
MRRVCIAEFCATGTGGTPPRDQVERYYEGGTIPWVKSGELREAVITDTEERITRAALDETSIKLVPSGALLLAMYGATVGRVGILGVPATTNQAVCHIIPDPKVSDVRYLFHAFRARISHLLSRRVGGAQPNISQGIVRDFVVPLPPLVEQRQTAGVLDRAEVLRAMRCAAISQLENLTQSVFLDLFGDPVTNPKGWPVECVGDVADAQSGLQVSSIRQKLPLEVQYLRVANVYRGYLDLAEVKTFRATESEVARTMLVKGDLLIVEGHGNPDEIGRCALWDGSIACCVHQNHLIRVRFDASRVLPDYASAFLNSSGGRRHLLRAGRTTSGLNTISVSDVRDAPISIPPLQLQREFLEHVAAVQRLKMAHRASLAEMDALFAALQHRAFRGGL